MDSLSIVDFQTPGERDHNSWDQVGRDHTSPLLVFLHACPPGVSPVSYREGGDLGAAAS